MESNIMKEALIIKNGKIQIQIMPHGVVLLNYNAQKQMSLRAAGHKYIYDLLKVIPIMFEDYFDTEHLQGLIKAYINGYVEEYIEHNIDDMTEKNYKVKYLTYEEYEKKKNRTE